MLADAELARLIHRRARRALLAGLEALNESARQRPASLPKKLRAETVSEALTLAVMRYFVLLLGRARGLFATEHELVGSRLFQAREDPLDVSVRLAASQIEAHFPAALAPAELAFHEELTLGLAADGLDFASCPAELVGNAYELLLGEAVHERAGSGFELASGAKRKQTGTFFTPRALTQEVAARALETLAQRSQLTVLDPAVGGGAFLLEVARALASGSTAGDTPAVRRALVSSVLHGVDSNPMAVAVAEAALALFVADPSFSVAEAGRNLRVGDALLGEPRARVPARKPALLRAGCDFPREFPHVFSQGGFDLVIGNPPWVAYAGRAAQPLEPAKKAYFAEQYASLRGYPTLHGLFVERALALAPRGTVALVVPSPIADLDGYRAVRRAVRSSHTPREPLLEFGQDAFASVTQPCFALIAEAGASLLAEELPERPLRLVERQRAGAIASEILPPAALAALADRPPFPRELFGEMGFQTTSQVTKHLLLRAPAPDARHDYPLLEGRDVREFSEGGPRLFLAADAEVLARARCRVRDQNDYRRVRFVVRQTARYPIAALHAGLPFRNSLLAGFAVDDLPPELVVGLLNSSLYRALHLALRRDARQAAFPQVKIAHLRALPQPPAGAETRAQIAELTTRLTQNGVETGARERLDQLVFELFSWQPADVQELRAFLRARGAIVS